MVWLIAYVHGQKRKANILLTKYDGEYKDGHTPLKTQIPNTPKISHSIFSSMYALNTQR